VRSRSPHEPPCHLDTVSGTVRLQILSPILSVEVLEELISILDSLAADRGGPLVMASAHSTVFLAGADLREISALDSNGCVAYAERGRTLVRLIEGFPSATVAAVNGSCSGGGFDIALAFDLIVAGPGASFSHPGVRRGLVTGWTGTVAIPPAIGTVASRAAFLEGKDISSAEAANMGFVRRTDADPVPEATEAAQELARLDPERRRLWRALRGQRFVDRFRASVVHKL
jgi:enoyl-CoA hydratase